MICTRLAVTLLAVLAGAGCGTPQADVADAPVSAATEQEDRADAERDREEELLERAVVRVRSLSCDGLGTGSGFLTADGRLITNHHVVDGGGLLEITTWGGRTLEARVDEVYADDDVAVLELDAEGLPAGLELSEYDADPGTTIRAAGYPSGGRYRVTSGEVIKYRTGSQGNRRMEISARIVPGNSGGPVVSDEGEVVGVAVELDQRDGAMLAIPSSRVRDIASGDRTKVIPCLRTQF